MDTVFIIIAIIILFAFGFFAAAWFLNRKFSKPHDDRSLLFLQNQMNELSHILDHRLSEHTTTVDRKLAESTDILQRQFGESTQIIRDVTERLTKLDETNRQVVNFADQLKSLQDILKNPKQRGILGEYYLETVLANVLPPRHFKMQYEFKDGSIVDAAIFVGDKIIPVDSKFSLENYNRLLETRDKAERERFETAFRQDLKSRIDETAKYVKPGENTMDFAFMFIPSEAVFYDVLINKVGSVNAKDLVEYAFNERKVIIVSPTSFFAYLQTVLQGLRALQIEESAKEIRKRVEELGRHIAGFETYMKKLGGHLGTAVGAFNSAYRELGKVDKDVLRVSGTAPGIEPESLTKPPLDTENNRLL